MAVNWNDQAVIAAINQAAATAVFAATEALKTAIVEKIKQPPKSGVIYRRRGVSHQASAPGEAPATDTGFLINSIATAYQNDPPIFIGTVTISASYAAALEYGTARVAARPFARPTLEEMKQDLEAIIAKELGAALK